MPIRLLIADDHEVVRAGLRTLLEADPELAVVGEAADGPETYRLVERLAPEIVILDIGMPGEDGIQVARRLKGAFPAVRVLFLTMHEDEALLREAMRAGASGYLIKRAEEAEILEAVHAVHRGDLYVHPALARARARAGLADATGLAASDEPLTPGEVAVLQLLARGYTNGQAAEALDLPLWVVDERRASLTAKLGSSSRLGLVTYAEEHGLL